MELVRELAKTLDVPYKDLKHWLIEKNYKLGKADKAALGLEMSAADMVEVRQLCDEYEVLRSAHNEVPDQLAAKYLKALPKVMHYIYMIEQIGLGYDTEQLKASALCPPDIERVDICFWELNNKQYQRFKQTKQLPVGESVTFDAPSQDIEEEAEVKQESEPEISWLHEIEKNELEYS